MQRIERRPRAAVVVRRPLYGFCEIVGYERSCVGSVSAVEPRAEIADIRPLRQLRALTRWVGGGRALTQTGRIKLADARELVALLDTGDELDPMDGRYRTTSSADLPGLCLLVEWAKACSLLRVVHGRLVPVKKNARLHERPSELWDRMFDAFHLLGPALCRDGWAQSFLRDEFQQTIEVVLLQTYFEGGTVAIGNACELAWDVATAPYRLDGATEQQRSTWRKMNDRDLRYALLTLEQLGAIRRAGDTMTLTELGLAGMRRAAGAPEPGDPVLQIKLSLLEVSGPPVWRRLLVPAGIRLDRLHDVIQAAMGWEDYHLHSFTAGGVEYGHPFPDLEHRDERKATLERLVASPGERIGYTYDFGDHWQHEIVVEKQLSAEPGVRYPVCTGGSGRCPPEDCGGSWGYAALRETLADPRDDEHEQMLEWLGLQSAAEFDAEAFDVDATNDSIRKWRAGMQRALA